MTVLKYFLLKMILEFIGVNKTVIVDKMLKKLALIFEHSI